MDSQIIAALIGVVGTIAAVIIGWWLKEKMSRKSALVSSKAIDPNVRGAPLHHELKARDEADASSLPLETSPVTSFSGITVKEIVEAINTAPPFQKEQIAKQYSGIMVKWTGYLDRVMEDFRDKESVRVNLRIEQDGWGGHSFWFSEKIAKFPEIRTLNRKSSIRVIGEITSATGEGLCVDIKPIKIEVLERHT